MPRAPAAILHRELALAAIEALRGGDAASLLSEAAMARRLGTSRAPVRGAFQLLCDRGVLARRPNGRLAIGALPAPGAAPLPDPESDAAEQVYWRLAQDRLAGRLPDPVGEAELSRRYQAPRGPVHRALLQATAEGWLERAPAGSWRFLSLIDGPAAHDEAYRFRRAIEPAALLDPGFDLPPATLARLRQEQQGLLARLGDAGATPRPNPREVFELNSGFHLALVQASGNRFFADAALRLTRLRRLVGYVIAQDQGRLAAQSQEHLAILDRLEAGERAAAAAALLAHLDAGRESKARLLAQAPMDPAPAAA